MDFKELSYILAMAEHQNVTKAANSLYLSQPTLTKFIQNLEKNLGQKLFRRVGNKFLLTYAGERYIEHGKEILLIKKELDNELADIKKSHVGRLNVAIPAVRGTYILPSTLPRFKELYPQLEINIREGYADQIERLVLSGETDLAFFNMANPHSDITYEVMGEEELLMVMSNKNPLVAQATKRDGAKHLWMDIHLCKEELFILQNAYQRTGQIVELNLKNKEISPIKPMIISNMRAAAKLVAENYGIAFVCDTHLNFMDLHDVSYFSWGDPCVLVDFVAAYRRDSYLSFHAKEYMNLLRKVSQEGNLGENRRI